MNIQRCPNCEAEIKAGTQICPHCGYAFPFATDMLDAGRVLQKRYELVKLIHSGGMGYIYLAQDRRLDREVVVKQVRQPVKSDAHRKKLEEEALRMAQLSHPAVAMVFDHFVEADFYFLVVEYIKGQTLSEIFEKSGRSLEESQVINWMVQVCEVIGYLHNKGMVHRDISPDNIMLTDEGHIKLIDFGTLHDLSMLASKKAGKEGKFGFTPKEQWDGNPTPQSDVFAIGATAYYLLTGYLQVSQACLRGENARPEDFNPVYPPITEERRDISDGLGMVLSKTLSPEYINRYGGATELGAALKALAYRVERVAPKAAMADKLELDTHQVYFGKIQPGAALSRKFEIANHVSKLYILSSIVVLLLLGVVIASGILAPKLQVSTLPSNFFNMRLESGNVDIRSIMNTGKLLLSGTTKSDSLWLKAYPTEINIKPGESMNLQVRVYTGAMSYGQKKTGSIIIDTNGGKALIPVTVSIIRDEVIFEDDLSNPNSGWDTGIFQDYEIAYTHGGLYIKVDKADSAGLSINNNIAELDDFVIETDVKWLTEQSVQSGYYAIDVRKSDGYNCYRFGVNIGDNICWIGKQINGELSNVEVVSYSTATNRGTAVNRMKITCQGANLKFYINDTLLANSTDYSLKKGKIALRVGRYKDTYHGVEALFDNFKVSIP